MLRVGGAVHQGVVQELFIAIKKGDSSTVRAMLEAGWRIEASQALYMFLARMQTPLIPLTIQRLVLGKKYACIDLFMLIDLNALNIGKIYDVEVCKNKNSFYFRRIS